MAKASGEALPDPQLVNPLQRRAAHPADQRMAIPAHQRIRHRPRARRAVKFRCLRLLRHPYFAASIFSTLIVLVFSSSVPVTVTFLAANFAGAF